MEAKKSLGQCIRGWLPKDHASTKISQTATSLLRKHPVAIGFGAGMGIPEGIQWTLYFLGAYSDQGRFFAAQLIIIPLFATLIAIGYWLSKKSQKKQTESPLINPSVTNKGWLPKEPYTIHSRESGNRKSGTPAYIVGYGVGIGSCEIFILLIYALGWGTIESNLSPALSILSEMLIVMSATILGWAIGAKLSEKLKERWVS